MLTNRSIPRCTVIPELAYPDVGEAADWLCDVFWLHVAHSRFPAQKFGKLPIVESDSYLVRVQDEHGFGEIVSAIMRAAETRLKQLSQRRRTTVPASELVVGLPVQGGLALLGDSTIRGFSVLRFLSVYPPQACSA